jgi:hypothetical protein
MLSALVSIVESGEQIVKGHSGVSNKVVSPSCTNKDAPLCIRCCIPGMNTHA